MTTDSEVDARILGLRIRLDQASIDLLNAVKEACPGQHNPIQHRDGKPPWCAHCGRGNDGFNWKRPR